MTIRKRRTIVSMVISAALVTGIAFESHRLVQAKRFNSALERADFTKAGTYATEHGGFARGFFAHAEGRLHDAAEIYAQLEHARDPAVTTAAKFNLANLYLEQSVVLSATQGPEMGIALIELAKASYRRLLREDSRHWDAKYNLAKALILLPDLDEVDSDDDIMPERSPRAPQAMRAYDRLP